VGVARYNALTQTLSDGDLNNLEVDSNGNLKTVLQSGVLSGFGYFATSTAATGTVQIKTGAGVLHSVCINKPAASGVLGLYDALSATNQIAVITLPATLLSDGPKCAIYDAAFSTGLFLSIPAAAMDATISYR
jgi:hypothetical protein